MTPRGIAFVDANVLIKGMTARWGAAKAVLILGALDHFRVTASDAVRVEVERTLVAKGMPIDADSEYGVLLRQLRRRFLPSPAKAEVDAAAPLLLPALRHRNDLPVLVSAIRAQPDWLVSENKRHFNPEVARLTGLRIVTPAQLLTDLVGRS